MLRPNACCCLPIPELPCTPVCNCGGAGAVLPVPSPPCGTFLFPPPPLSTVNGPFLLPDRCASLSILPAAPGRPVPALAELEAVPGAGAMGRGKMGRSLLPPAEVEDAGDDLDDTEATERGDGPLADGDGVLAEMVAYKQERKRG